MGTVTGSHLIVNALKLEGVTNIFLLAGDHVLPLMDLMADHVFRLLDTRHEQAAVHMADTWGRITGQAGVSLVTTPGHANAVPGLANAMHSESPVVHISGSAESVNLGKGAMQEIDQVGMAAPVTKGAWMVPDVYRIPEYIAMAFRYALSGRRGPVHLTIPIDLQRQVVDEARVNHYQPPEYRFMGQTPGDPEAIRQAVSLLQQAQRPMVIAGSVAGYTATREVLEQFLETTHLPLFTEEQARGLVSDDHPYCLGFADIRLSEAAERLREADVVLLLGKKLDFTVGFGGPPALHPDARIIQVEPAAATIGRSRGIAVGIVGDIGAVMEQLTQEGAHYQWRELPWLDELRATRAAQVERLESLATEKRPVHAMFVHRAMERFLDSDTCLVFDGGDYCHFGRAYHKATRPGRWLYCSTLGMIGVGLPMALAAQVAYPGSRVVLLVGDGSFGFNGMEFDTAVRHNLPIVAILGNDSAWGIDYQIQVGLYGRPVCTELVPSRYDKVVEGLGGHGEHVEHPSELAPALERAFASGRPALVNVQVQRAASSMAQKSIIRQKGSV